MDARIDPPSGFAVIDLAREPDFSLGASKVSPSTREVLRGAERELLEPRLMQVLVALFQANGRVVSRDELIARCWEGRIVGEDAINRAISRLRRLSEVDREASFQLETIPRVGYRLLPAGQRAPAENPVLSAPDITAPPRQNVVVRHRLVIAAAAAVAVAVTTAWLLWPERKWTVENGRPFLASLTLETDPAFSPDGATLAYSMGPEGGRQIYIRNLAAGDGIRVSNDDFDVMSPTWSSDGGHLAYAGSKPGEPCHLMVATVPAGAAHEAGRCRHTDSTSVTWQPGTDFLYYFEHGDLTGDSIIRLDLDSGAQAVVVTMPRLNQTIVSPHCSPDGKWLAYVLVDDIIVRDLASGRERKLAPFEQRGAERAELTWTPDSRAILASVSSGTGSRIIAFPINGGPSYPVYTTAMRLGTLAAGKDALALTTIIMRINFARPVATATDPPDVVDAANGSSLSPSFAPDGTLAFISNRSGNYSVWLQKPGGAATQLFDAGFAPLSRVQFSPDGSRLAVVTESIDTTDIKIMTPDGASLKSFTTPSLGLGLPTWTPDGKAILVFDRRDKRTWRIDVNDLDKRNPFTPPHWVGIAVRPEGIFATRADKPGIWRIDAVPHLVTGKYPAFYYPPLAFIGGEVLVPDYTGLTPRLLAQNLSGGADRVLGYMPGALSNRFRQTALAVNPKTGDILYTATVGSDSNIDLLTLAKH
jgi:Tol biopolymer transport system component/DNA-binding winged helix-turn-helix (wHTH) protein